MADITSNHSKDRIILGVDPGTNIMGFGLICVKQQKMSLIAVNELILNKISDPYSKLKHIFQRTLQLIDTYHPDEMALEAPFYGKNVQSMLKIGRAQGVAMAAALARQIPLTEYAPRKIKLAITGSGTASKEQVAAMLQHLLGLKQRPTKNTDATDGLAAAVCHFFNTSHVIYSNTAKYNKGWSSFIEQNPQRVK